MGRWPRLVIASIVLAACGAPPPPRPPVVAQRASCPSCPVTTVDRAWDELCAGASSVPMEIAGSREFVMVTLRGPKGEERLRFHVDTGGNTPGIALERAVAKRLGFDAADTIPRELQIGDHHVPFPEGAAWVVIDAPEVDPLRKHFSVGQIGAGFLSRFVVCVDPTRRRLGLGDPRRFVLDPAGAEWIPLFFQQGGKHHALYPFVHLQLHDRDGAFAAGYGVLLDTGAASSFLERGKIQSLHRDHPSWGMAQGAAGDADMIAGRWPEAMLAPPFVVFDAPKAAARERGLATVPEVRGEHAVFVDRPDGTWTQMFGDVVSTGGSHGAVANDVLLGFDLIVDYPRARLYMRPSKHARDRSASMTRVGVSIAFGVDGCPIVRQITDTNTERTRAALRQGDVVVRVGDLDACRAWHHEIEAALSGSPGEIRRLRIRRDGEEHDVDVEAAALLGPLDQNFDMRRTVPSDAVQ